MLLLFHRLCILKQVPGCFFKIYAKRRGAYGKESAYLVLLSRNCIFILVNVTLHGKTDTNAFPFKL